MDSARDVRGCRLTQETRVRNAFDDVSRTIHQSLPPPPPAQSCRDITCSVPAMNACFTPLRRTFPLVVLEQGRKLTLRATIESSQLYFRFKQCPFMASGELYGEFIHHS